MFWSLLAGSFAIIGLVITKTGYAKNFAHWDISLRKFGGLFLSFLAAFVFYEGLIHFNFWVIPMFVAVLGLGFTLFLYKSRI